MNQTVAQLSSILGRKLAEQGLTVTAAESCTGGGIAAALTSVPGSSEWFGYGFVTYSNAAKQALLGVDAMTLQACGAVSREVVLAMAAGARQVAGADLSVAVSGVAGPGGGSADKPVGSVWIAWEDSRAACARSFLFTGDRAAVREQSVVAALQGLADRV